MTLEQDFQYVWSKLRQDANFKPRDYQTIGGGWTTDTWEEQGVRALLQDEGYTRVIVLPGVFSAYQTADRPVQITQGKETDFYELILPLFEMKAG